MDKRFLTAFLNPPKYKIGGIELDYFCPRHFITLQGLDSPFLNPEKANGISFKHLFEALRVCSTPSWTEAVKKPKFSERIKYYILEGMMQRQLAAYAEFGNYLNESMTVPKIWTKEDDSSHPKKPSNLPETVSLTTILITKFGFTEEQAWNMPFAKAIWYVTAYGVQEGAELSIITTEDEENEGMDVNMLKKFEENMQKLLSSKNKGKDIKIL